MRFKLGKYDIRIDWFKSKEQRAALDKFDAQTMELQKYIENARKAEREKKHAAFIKRVRGGHLVHLAKLKQINKARKIKPAPVKYIGLADENTIFMDQYEATMWKRNAA